MPPGTLGGMDRSAVPPGWPEAVIPPGGEGWVDSAVAWLLDACPPDYRLHDVWRRQPVALAWVARFHLAGQVAAMRDAFRAARVELRDDLPPEAVPEVLAALETEGLRLRAAARGADLIVDALRGHRHVPRL